MHLSKSYSCWPRGISFTRSQRAIRPTNWPAATKGTQARLPLCLNVFGKHGMSDSAQGSRQLSTSKGSGAFSRVVNRSGGGARVETAPEPAAVEAERVSVFFSGSASQTEI